MVSVGLQFPCMSLDCTAKPAVLCAVIAVLCVTADLSTLEEPKTIYLADMTDSGLFVDPRRMTFRNADGFKQFLTRSGVGALIDVTEDRDPTSDDIVTEFDQIQSMHNYVEKVSALSVNATAASY